MLARLQTALVRAAALSYVLISLTGSALHELCGCEHDCENPLGLVRDCASDRADLLGADAATELSSTGAIAAHPADADGELHECPICQFQAQGQWFAPPVAAENDFCCLFCVAEPPVQSIVAPRQPYQSRAPPRPADLLPAAQLES
ncbi:MAG TPA: hypothetical protein VFE24_03410 [Pirellulales bacterium]|jgi:hypothetical protein|nr:hypothetical protein [Pirellulales bacterium]